MPSRELMIGSLKALAFSHIVVAPLLAYFVLWPAICAYGFDMHAPIPGM